MSGLSALPARFAHGVRIVVVRLWNRNGLVDASAMAFSLFLASIPLLALAGTVVAGLLAGEPHALSLVSSLVNVAPEAVRGLVSRHLSRGVNQGAAPAFLAGATYLGASAFHDAMTVFEGAVGAKPRSWLKKRLIAMGCVLGLLFALFVLGTIAAIVAGGPLELVVTLIERAEAGYPRAVALSLVALLSTLLVAAFFRIAVRHRSARPPVFPGAVATIAMGLLASVGFAAYSSTIARYALFYGSLAAVAIFLLWLWLCCVALLIGVEVNAHIERRREGLPTDPGDSVPPRSGRVDAGSASG